MQRQTFSLLAGGTAVALALAVTAGPQPTAGAVDDGVQHPVFVDGQAQPVYTDSASWIREEGWAIADVDSDGDGAPDRIHFDITRPAETEEGVKLPVLMEASPYYAGGNDVVNHDVHHELWEPGKPGRPDRDWVRRSDVGPSIISNSMVNTWVPRGFAVMHVESVGTGESEGCPTIGGPEETAAVKAVIDWVGGRARAVDADGAPLRADWTTTQVGMMGTSYNGTLPNAVASTGVPNLKAIVPVSAIDNWYDYYRADGAVVAPGGYQGEDEDVLFDYVYTRADREICKPVRAQIARDQDRTTGDHSSFWSKRNYLKDARKVRAAVFVVHGLQDNNVKTRQAAEWYAAVSRRVPHRIYWHQGGHGGAAPATDLNKWFTHFLFDVDNDAETAPHAIIEREDGNDVTYADWPVPGSGDVVLRGSAPGDDATGDLSTVRGHGRSSYATFSDIPTQTVEDLVESGSSEHGLVFTSAPLTGSLHLSGTPTAELRFSLGQGAANVTVGVVDIAPDGSVARVISEGWRDPQNRRRIDRTLRVRPGQAYAMDVTLQANDYVFAPGHRVGVVVMQSELDYTILPPAGNELTLDMSRTTFGLPFVGGPEAFLDATR
ncbi:Xaa-Pro dipeptidyl-peptidase [Nocardioides sp. Root140]|uniref:Xaa-Pro dipeptidyl-peptidase n=1 Tax=Nocardioides sp. Root140 TaxID=1736460 RepID=UPI0006F5BFAE|nr:Xaa-Pro dipeptidyl-peptidase [Nocardioides sp. Root140]KQY64085.1 hypothetical protein ASD30_03715 [Nocardioides sp. Root140]